MYRERRTAEERGGRGYSTFRKQGNMGPSQAYLWLGLPLGNQPQD